MKSKISLIMLSLVLFSGFNFAATTVYCPVKVKVACSSQNNCSVTFQNSEGYWYYSGNSVPLKSGIYWFSGAGANYSKYNLGCLYIYVPSNDSQISYLQLNAKVKGIRANTNSGQWKKEAHFGWVCGKWTLNSPANCPGEIYTHST